MPNDDLAMKVIMIPLPKITDSLVIECWIVGQGVITPRQGNDGPLVKKITVNDATA